MLFTSARNSIAAHTSLLETMRCKVLLAPTPNPQIISDIAQATSLPIIKVPSIDNLLDTEYRHVPFSKTLKGNGNDTFAVVHTSGSTGLPKPIEFTFAVGAAFMKMTQLSTPEGFDSLYRMIQEKRIFVTVPPFHVRPSSRHTSTIKDTNKQLKPGGLPLSCHLQRDSIWSCFNLPYCIISSFGF